MPQTVFRIVLDSLRHFCVPSYRLRPYGSLLFDEFRGPVFFFCRLLKSVACSGEDFFYAVYRFATELGGTPQQLVLSLVEGVGIHSSAL